MLHQSVTAKFPTESVVIAPAVAAALSKPFAGLRRHSYGAILADPAWRFITRSPKGQGRSPSRHYKDMAFDEIAALPVADLTMERAFLFLWVPLPHLPLGLQLIERWGFKYSGSAFCWAKPNRTRPGWAMGGGYGTRKNVELCLQGRRGKSTQALIQSRRVRELIVAPRREHSRKPDEQYQRIEELVPGPYLELFARQQWPGWTSWGEEATRFTAAGEGDAR
jgi:N6-adenosine-specific RNA methylase IME4